MPTTELPTRVVLTQPKDNMHRRELSRLAIVTGRLVGVADAKKASGLDHDPLLAALERAFELGRQSGAEAANRLRHVLQEDDLPPAPEPEEHDQQLTAALADS